MRGSTSSSARLLAKLKNNLANLLDVITDFGDHELIGYINYYVIIILVLEAIVITCEDILFVSSHDNDLTFNHPIYLFR